jgi:chitinase
MQRGRVTAKASEISGLTKSVNTALDKASVNSKALAVERKVLPGRDEALLNQGDALSYRVTEALGGVPKNVMIKIEDIATKYNANLAFRSRGFGAIEKLQKGLAYFKPQPMKLKNTNKMDVEWFGFPAQALDQVIFVEPPAEILRAFREVFDDPSSYTSRVVDGVEVRIYKKNLPNDIRITRALDEWVKKHPKFDSLGITDKPGALTALDLVLDSDVITKIDDFDKPAKFEEYLAVRERLRLHGEEWFDYQKPSKFGPLGEDGFTLAEGKYVKEGLPLEFEYAANGLPAVLDQLPYLKGSKREFRLAEGAVIDNPNGDLYTQLLTTDGRRIFTPQMNGPNGFRGFTGDIDFMHILDVSGAIISNPIRRFLIYYELAKEVGMQHGESFTFALNEASRSRYLNAHDVASPVREVLYSVFPNRVKVAAFYAKHRSILADLGNGVQQVNSGEKVRQYFVPITGGNHRLRTAALRTLSESIELILKPTSNWERFISSLDRSLNWIVPLHWLSRASGVNDSDVDSKYRSDRGSDDNQIVQERDGELVTLQPTANRSMSRKFQIPAISYEWQPVEPAAVQDANGLISSLPFSALRIDFAANSTQLEVARLDELGMDADSSFIQEDDFLVISPATSTEEAVRVISINPLVIESGLRFDHYAGEMVAVLPLRFFSVTAIDSDGDGSWDIDDLFPSDPAEYADSDLDGVGDNADTDDDNDGYTDTEELLAGSSSTNDLDTPIEHRPVTPVITSTMPATLEPTSGLYIETSFFDDPDLNATRSSNRIRISRQDLAAERRLVYEGDVQSLDPLRLSKSILDLDVNYTLELSYVDDTGLASDYSEPLDFNSPAADPFDTDDNLMQDGIETSADQDFNGNGELDSSEGIVTVAQLGEGEIRGIQSSAGSITRVTGYSPDELPADLTLNNGMIGYRVDGLAVGQTVVMTYWFSSDISAGYRWYQYNESTESESNLIDRTGDIAVADNYVRLSITDGGERDLDGVVNGRIVDASGGVHSDGSDIAGDPEPTNPSGFGGSGGGCSITSEEAPFNPTMAAMILGSIGMLAFRRRRILSGSAP